mmetsp:Transcript_16560/g.47166  ORF Transcript_16560/g.47166 Transcript_16560/m.47166 type:complete len:287 (-) Transcript_16560:11937-12797(-)
MGQAYDVGAMTWPTAGMKCTIGSGVYISPKTESTTIAASGSHFAPSSIMPLHNTPSSGCSWGSSKPQIPNLNDNVSIATMYLRAKVCKVPVMNPCGKKKTGSGKLTGRPLTSQVRMNSMRDRASFIHDPSVFIVAKLTFSQMGGSWLFINPTYMSSRSEDMMASPPIARLNKLRDEDMFVMSRLNLTISCINTVSSDVNKPLSWITKVVGPLSSSSNSAGMRSSASSITSITISSEDFPPPPPPSRGCSARIEDMSVLLSARLKVILAFSCMPNISGSSICGKEEK